VSRLPEWEDYRIVLIEQKPRLGHWVCLARRIGIFIFFDIYGYNPFQNLNLILKKMNELLGQEETDFSGLFKGLKKLICINYNKKNVQKLDSNINTYLFIIQILICIYYSNTYLFKYFFNSNTYSTQIIFFCIKLGKNFHWT